jgi:hypothetical protein
MEARNHLGHQNETGVIKTMKKEAFMSSPVHFRAMSITSSEYYCPFGDAESSVCSASLSSMVIGISRRQTYCGGDDYDNCPIFLARMLRRKD